MTAMTRIRASLFSGLEGGSNAQKLIHSTVKLAKEIVAPAPRIALGRSVEAKWSKMKQPEKSIDFLKVFDDLGGELARQLLQKESPESHASPEESSWRKYGSKMEQNEANSKNHCFSIGF